MQDLIDRQAAIDALQKCRKHCIDPFDSYHIDIQDAENQLMKLPTIQPEVLACGSGELVAQPEPQWIPVERELPEDMQFVLLTVRRLKNGYNHEPFISVGYIGWNHQHWWCAHDGDCEISKVEVIAWMPLPEAYKPNK